MPITIAVKVGSKKCRNTYLHFTKLNILDKAPLRMLVPVDFAELKN
ncbi:9686_t:CDS:1, partial [Funneliformis geosporum]